MPSLHRPLPFSVYEKAPIVISPPGLAKSRYGDAIHGEQGEHLIVKMGFAQVANLDRAIAKYVDQYQPREGL